MIDTPHILPWKATPSNSFPTGVRTVRGTTGRWFNPSSTSSRMILSDVLL